jgi:hypothetical protein
MDERKIASNYGWVATQICAKIVRNILLTRVQGQGSISSTALPEVYAEMVKIFADQFSFLCLSEIC